MASVLTNYQGNLMLAQIGDGSTNRYVALFSASPTDVGLFTNEVTGGGYSRQQTPFTAPSTKTIGNTTVLQFTNMPAFAGNVIHYVGVCRTLSGTTNDLLAYAQINGSTGLAYTTGQTIRFEINDIAITI